MYIDGKPDFSPFAIKINGHNSISVAGMTGNSGKDNGLADSAARAIDPSFVRPGDATWHHTPGGTHMVLVPKNIHDPHRHFGGASDLRKMTGARR
jgi:hypothetical protein